MSHIFDLAEDLESVVQRSDHTVQTVSDEFNLGIEGDVGGQIADGDRAECAELAQSGGVLLEKPKLK